MVWYLLRRRRVGAGQRVRSCRSPQQSAPGAVAALPPGKNSRWARPSCMPIRPAPFALRRSALGHSSGSTERWHQRHARIIGGSDHVV